MEEWPGLALFFELDLRELTKFFTALTIQDNGLGAYPMGALVQASDGNLYGLSAGGGTYQKGTIFMVTPDGQAKLFYSFGAFESTGTGPDRGPDPGVRR